MEKYINYLISDLQKTKQNVPPDPELGTEDTYEEFAEKMFAIETAPDVEAKELFGVSYEELPPAEKLTKQQMQKILIAIEDTFTTFNFSLEYPENVPLKLRYQLMRKQFAEPVHYMPGFTHHYDFCTGWCPDCEILDYCEIWKGNWTPEEIKEEQQKANKQNSDQRK